MMNGVARTKTSSFCQGAQICILLVSILFVFTYPVSGEVDPQYKEQLTGLTAKFLTTGFSEEEIQRIFSDEREELYPQILERKSERITLF